MRPGWVPAIVALLLLAGCAGTAETEDPQSDETAPPTVGPVRTGSLAVYVVDPQLQPLAGASVTLSTNTSTVADPTGLAAFDGLPEGAIVMTVSLEGYRTATSAVTIQPGQQSTAEVKLLPSPDPGTAAPADGPYRQPFHLRGFFDCSATYVIITGDCMLLVDTITGDAGLGTPAGDMTNEEFTLDFPLDHGWTSIVGEMHWQANGAANGEQMTFALEPTEYDTGGHAPKYARSEGGSPLRWVVHNGEPHESATASADGETPDVPNPDGGEVVRTRSYVAGQIAHRPAGTGFLGIGAAVSQEFEVVVTAFYGERAAEDFTAA